MILKTDYIYNGSQFPFLVEMREIEDIDYLVIREWCIDQFGNPATAGRGVDTNARWLETIVINGVRFKNEADRIWFVLRWS